MNDKQVLRTLQECGAVHLDSHFCLTPKEIPPGSGVMRHYHSDTFVAKDRVFENARELYVLAGEIANRYLDDFNGHPSEFVLGLEKGAIALANLVALHLQLRGYGFVRSGYAEAKPDGGFTIGRGFARKYSGKNVLIVEDIIVSGTSVRGAIEAVRANGGNPTCVYAICLRGDANTGDVPFNYLYQLEGARMWQEDECPLCADPQWGPQSIRVDVNKHGPEFFHRKGLPLPTRQPDC